MRTRSRLVGVLVACLVTSSLLLVDGARRLSAQGPNTITLTLSIVDADGGFSLMAKKAMIQGANAFDAVRQIVSLEYATDPQFGPFITGLAGISPRAGWRLYVDGEPSNLGIAGIALQGDTVLEFKTQ
ncbi:MAG: DUF4430 domain-containing protein [Acidobacteria bacterium]|nr:DUF4430 domain-containing protein [Acidobacteriota bacterium]